MLLNRNPTDLISTRQKEYTMHLSNEQIFSRAGPSKPASSADLKPPSSLYPPSSESVLTPALTTMSQSEVALTDPFHQWRPTSHVLAPQGWMNDPCGPSYDPRTGFYHLWYQWNPKGSTWGNMSWGHAISVDMIHWKSSPTAVIEPGTNHDQDGVFTGYVLHRSPLGLPNEAIQDGQMTAIYTAVSKLPIHHTLPYNYGSEKVVISTSDDGGNSWIPQGVLLPGPPENENVTAWRDPYISEWPLLDVLLAKRQPGLYALIAGGLRDETPTVFAYSVNPADLSSWSYIGPLCDVGLNQKAAPYGVDLGKNWEVANFFNLKDDSGKQEEYLLINVEGCIEPGPARASVCMKLDVLHTQIGKRGICLQPDAVSMLDHGCLYAASSFHDQARDRRIMWGWITEDDLPEEYYDQQGWSGMLSLPRELFAHPTSQDVGIRPVEEVALLREGALHQRLHLAALTSLSSSRSQLTTADALQLETVCIVGVQSRSLEVQMNLDEQVRGLTVAHNRDLSTRTMIYFDAAAGEIVIDRTQSAGKQSVLEKGIKVNTSTLRARIPEQSGNGSKTIHTLRLFVDNSVLEVFVDDLVAISTRIYPDACDSGLSLLLAPQTSQSFGGSVDIWQGLSKAHLGFLS